jgi:DNA-binding Lrp family transcriptional regulator
MDAIDSRLLNLIQKNFPLTPQPFAVIALQLGVSEKEVLQRISQLKDKGIIRRIGGSFNSRKLGYASTLCAMKVTPNSIENTIKIINSYPEITHNYFRRHEFNLWFTIIAKDEQEIGRIIAEIKTQTNPEAFINLPAVRVFKLDVNFQINEG